MSTLTAARTEGFDLRPLSAAIRNVEGTATDTQVVALEAESFRRLDGDNRWRMILCTRGEIWITQERDLEDYVLKPGDIFLVTQRGKVLIEALCDALVEITPSLRKAPYRGNYRLQA